MGKVGLGQSLREPGEGAAEMQTDEKVLDMSK